MSGSLPAMTLVSTAGPRQVSPCQNTAGMTQPRATVKLMFSTSPASSHKPLLQGSWTAWSPRSPGRTGTGVGGDTCGVHLLWGSSWSQATLEGERPAPLWPAVGVLRLTGVLNLGLPVSPPTSGVPPGIEDQPNHPPCHPALSLWVVSLTTPGVSLTPARLSSHPDPHPHPQGPATGEGAAPKSSPGVGPVRRVVM